jgi:hypothetical protein
MERVMKKIMFAILAAAGTAFAALASNGAGADGDEQFGGVQNGWRADSEVQPCRIEKRWQRDYAGQLYLKKVRICA